MKKRNKLTKKIMNKVVRHEEHVLLVGVSEWSLVGVIFLVLVILGLGDLIAQLNEAGTGDFVWSIMQYEELRKEFFWSLKEIVLSELPLLSMSRVFVLILVLVIVLWVLVGKSMKAKKKWQEMEEYKKKQK